MTITRRTALAVALGAACSTSVRAQSFPTKQIRLVVPYPGGGPTDALARLIATLSRVFPKLACDYPHTVTGRLKTGKRKNNRAT